MGMFVNAPICDGCWDLKHPEREPVRLTKPNNEECCFCGEHTKSGIYVRENRAMLPFPPQDEE